MLYLGTYYNRKVLSNWKQVRERSDTSLSWLVSHCCIFIHYMLSITLVFSPFKENVLRYPIIELLLLGDNMKSKAKALNAPLNYLT